MLFRATGAVSRGALAGVLVLFDWFGLVFVGFGGDFGRSSGDVCDLLRWF